MWLSSLVLSVAAVLAGCASYPPATNTDKSMGSEQVGAAADDRSRPLPTSEFARNEQSPFPAGEVYPPASMDAAIAAVPHGESVMALSKLRQETDEARERDTWERIRAGLSLPHPLHSRVIREIHWYVKHQKYLHRVTRRARPYLPYIVREIEQRNIPLEFALLPVVESAFRVHAHSPADAVGLWQFIPATGRLYGLKQNWWYDGRRDAIASTRAALDYLSKLLRDFDGDRLLAAAAYNWGEGNVMRAIARNRARGKPGDVWSLKLPRETRAHVSRLLAIAAIVKDPDRYGVVLEPIPYRVHFQEVSLDGQIDLGVAARLAGITLDEIRQLNTGFKHSITDPNGPHRLQLPANAVERFKSRLLEQQVKRPVRWARHKIAYGETLGIIANRYRTSVTRLREINRLASDQIRAGHHLLVPASTVAQGGLRRSAAARIPVQSFHRVRSGDSLWRIAHTYGVDVDQLAAWNGLSMKTTLQPGQKLHLIPAAYSKTPGSRKSIRYRVKRGDTLWLISQQFGVSIASLREWNRLSKEDPLMPGRVLDVHLPSAPTI